MKIHFTKKQLLTGGVVILLLAGAAVIGVVYTQFLNKPPVVEQLETPSGLPQQVDETQSLRLSGDAEEANKKADELLAQAGTSNETKYMLYIQKGFSSVEAQDLESALNFFTEASKLSETSQVYTHIGEVNFTLGNKAAARTAYEKALTLLDPNSPITEGDRRDLQQRIDIIDGKETPQ